MSTPYDARMKGFRGWGISQHRVLGVPVDFLNYWRPQGFANLDLLTAYRLLPPVPGAPAGIRTPNQQIMSLLL